MSALVMKSARLDLKTTSEAKELLGLAASLSGLDVSSFVLGTAVEKARTVIKESTSLTLSRQGQINFVNALNRQTGPTNAMKELMNLPDFPVTIR